MSVNEKIVSVAGGLLLFAFLCLGIFGENGLMGLIGLKKQYSRVVEKNEMLQSENKMLLHEIERLNNDLEYVGNLARRELGYVSEEEFVFKSRKK